ncbi:MAG TPA: signal peptidase II [Streptosporangiaceae bacterium]
MQAARGTSLSGSHAAQQDGPEPSRPSRPRVSALLAIAVAVLAIDIASKVTVVATLSRRAPIRLLGGFLTLRVDRNPGAAFSIGPSLTIVFSAIAVGVIIYILRTSAKIRSLAWAASLGLLLGGAAGNLVDRLFRSPGPLRGYAVDWIEVPHWPVFNLADSAIVCGGVLAVLLAARGIRIDGSRVTDTAEPAGQAGDAAPQSPQPGADSAGGQHGSSRAEGEQASHAGRGQSETGAAAPSAAAPRAGDPSAGDPSAGDPGAGDPGAAGPGAAGPGVAGPAAAGPGAAGSSAAGPGMTTGPAANGAAANGAGSPAADGAPQEAERDGGGPAAGRRR